MVDNSLVSVNGDAHSRWDALGSLLARSRTAIVAALADDGFRIEMPATFELGGHQALAIPADRATMLDVVVPADRLAVVGLWDRAQRTGMEIGAVHALSDPDRLLTITVVDVRDRIGVWLAVLTDDAGAAEPTTDLLADSLIVTSRPRLATSHKSRTAIITAIDANVTRMLGWTAEQMLGVRASEFIHPDDCDRAIVSWMELLSHSGSQRIRLRHRCRDGSWLWVEIEQVHNGAADPDAIDVASSITDISEEMAAHEALRRREQLFSRLAESLPTGVLQLQQDRSVAYANARLSTILGIAPRADATAVVAAFADEDRARVDAALRDALNNGTDCELEVDVLRPRTSERRRCALTVAAVHDQEGQPGALICVSDVTDSARLRAELNTRATVDALTGCLNRASIMTTLDQFLARPDQQDTAVIFVDIDNFKPVNDRLGHAAGDELLIHLARLLQQLTRGDDVVGRLGGDEFLLVCRGHGLRTHIATIAKRLQNVVSHPVVLEAGTVNLRVSTGIAYAEPNMICDTVVAQADTAMYQSKRNQNGHPVFYDEIIQPTLRGESDRWDPAQIGPTRAT